MALIGVLPVLALLNVFGQDPVTYRADTADASLRVTAPAALRGGLLFQVRVDLTARRDLTKPQLILSRGSWQEMSVNAVEPQPMNEATSNGSVVLSYDKLAAGQKLAVWLYFQVNPTNVGRHDENFALYDGSRPVAHIHRSVMVWP